MKIQKRGIDLFNNDIICRISLSSWLIVYTLLISKFLTLSVPICSQFRSYSCYLGEFTKDKTHISVLFRKWHNCWKDYLTFSPECWLNLVNNLWSYSIWEEMFVLLAPHSCAIFVWASNAVCYCHPSSGTRLHGMNSYHSPGNGFVKPEPALNASLPAKKPGKPQQQILGSHNHNYNLLHHSERSHSPLALKKHSPKQNHTLQQPVNSVNQALLSMMPSGHGLSPSPHMGMMNHNQNSLPPRPHSASGNMSGQVYAPVGSHGDQTLPYMAQQGQFVNHLPFSQPLPQPQPQPQVFYPGAYYFYYPQQ